MPKNIKTEFGRLMRLSRETMGMSRATLAIRLGISPKTIQSWETGRTFIERLDLIPQLEAELECSLSTLIAKATGTTVAVVPAAQQETTNTAVMDEHQMGSTSQQRLPTRPGPLSPKFTLDTTASVASNSEVGEAEIEWVSVPMLKPKTLLGLIFEPHPCDILRQVIIPREWVPRASVLVAVRMGDSAMMPMIPLGATVIIDLCPVPVEKSISRITALEFAGKGLRIRRVIHDMASNRYYGASITEHGRAPMHIRPSKGDRVLGKVIGVMASV